MWPAFFLFTYSLFRMFNGQKTWHSHDSYAFANIQIINKQEVSLMEKLFVFENVLLIGISSLAIILAILAITCLFAEIKVSLLYYFCSFFLISLPTYYSISPFFRELLQNEGFSIAQRMTVICLSLAFISCELLMILLLLRNIFRHPKYAE